MLVDRRVYCASLSRSEFLGGADSDSMLLVIGLRMMSLEGWASCPIWLVFAWMIRVSQTSYTWYNSRMG